MSPSLVGKILNNYESDTPGTKSQLYRILMHGKLAGTGRILVLPVDQGFEHGPARSFALNPAAYDPHYHFHLAIDAGVSAFAAPLGLLEAGVDTFAGQMPLILKLNHASSLVSLGEAADQALVASVQDALRLGCSAIGFTIYPGSVEFNNMLREFAAIAAEAKAHGLAVVVWSYPRGQISKKGETSLDVVAYAAHMAALLGAHIIKVKLPTDNVELAESSSAYKLVADSYHHQALVDNSTDAPLHDLSNRVKHIVAACFAGKRIVVFSGGEAKDEAMLYDEVTAIARGGGYGSIIGRNAFQRSREQALEMLRKIMHIYATHRIL